MPAKVPKTNPRKVTLKKVVAKKKACRACKA
jgi:hypothetical protein